MNIVDRREEFQFVEDIEQTKWDRILKSITFTQTDILHYMAVMHRTVYRAGEWLAK